MPPNPQRSPSIKSSSSSLKSKRSSYFESYPQRKRSSVLNSEVASLSSSNLSSNRLSKQSFVSSLDCILPDDDLVDLENSLWTVLNGNSPDSSNFCLSNLDNLSINSSNYNSSYNNKSDISLHSDRNFNDRHNSIPRHDSQLTLSNKYKHDLSLGLLNSNDRIKGDDNRSNSIQDTQYESIDLESILTSNIDPPSPKLIQLIDNTKRPRKSPAPPSSTPSSRVQSFDSLRSLKVPISKRKSLQRMNSRASFRADEGSEESDLDLNASLTDVASKYGFSNTIRKSNKHQLSPKVNGSNKSKTIFNNVNGWSDDEDRDQLGPPPPPSNRLRAKASKRALKESKSSSNLCSRSPSILHTTRNLPSPLLRPVDSRATFKIRSSEPSTPNSTSPRSPYSFSTGSVVSTARTESDIGRMQSKESLAESYKSGPSITSTKVNINKNINIDSSDDELDEETLIRNLPTPIPRSISNLKNIKPYDESLTQIKPRAPISYGSLQKLKNADGIRRATLSTPVKNDIKNVKPRSSLPSHLQTPFSVSTNYIPYDEIDDSDEPTPKPNKTTFANKSMPSLRKQTSSNLRTPNRYNNSTYNNVMTPTNKENSRHYNLNSSDRSRLRSSTIPTPALTPTKKMKPKSESTKSTSLKSEPPKKLALLSSQRASSGKLDNLNKTNEGITKNLNMINNSNNSNNDNIPRTNIPPPKMTKLKPKSTYRQSTY